MDIRFLDVAQKEFDEAVELRVMKSVPPRGSGWVSCSPSVRVPLNETHPLPRGGTDFMTRFSLLVRSAGE